MAVIRDLDVGASAPVLLSGKEMIFPCEVTVTTITTKEEECVELTMKKCRRHVCQLNIFTKERGSFPMCRYSWQVEVTAASVEVLKTKRPAEVPQICQFCSEGEGWQRYIVVDGEELFKCHRILVTFDGKALLLRALEICGRRATSSISISVS